MNPFKCRMLDHYSPAILRLLLGAVIFLAGLFRKAILFLFSIESQFLNMLLAAASLLGLVYILTALMEIITLCAHRRHQALVEMPFEKVRTLEIKLFPAEKVLSALEREPILTLQIVADDRLLLVSAASDCREVHESLFKSRNEFFNKAYYINDEYLSFDDFRTAFAPYIQNGNIAVHKVDDLLISKYDCDPFDP